MSSGEQPTLEEWLREDPFTLSMSAGFFGFFAHAGVVTAMQERDLAPSATRGSSAGAMITAFWAAGIEPEQMRAELSSMRRGDFWDPGLGAGLLKGELMDEKLRSILPVTEIEECSVPVHISVYDARGRRTEVLERGDIALATRASCALPGLFQPVSIDGRPKLDGGIGDREGHSGAPEAERIFHHHLAPKMFRPKSGPAHHTTGNHPNTKVLEINGLPRVSPFSLHKGMVAYEHARLKTLEAFDQPA